MENGELVIAEDEVEIIQMIFDRYIHTNDGINGVANYLNNHGYTKKLRQNGTIPGFSSSFIKKIIDNPVYMGKIAYGRRRTEKKTGTRNETHVVEQSDLQRRLDTQYDKIDEVEETMAELKSQIYELKKNQIDADSIYGFLGAFNEVYSECTDAEKKQFMQAFIERIDIFSERREDGNWIQNIKFQFPVPIIKEGKEVAQIKGISLDNEKSDEHMIFLEKLSTLETVVLLSNPK